MTTQVLTAYGLTFETEDSVIETGFTLLDQLHIEKESPMVCIQTLSEHLKITSGNATAIYAKWASKNKPIF